MQKIRVGLIGAGWVATHRHLPALEKIPNVNVTLICSRSRERACQVAREFHIPSVVDSWEDVCGGDVEAVIVATPPGLHLPATLAALQSGKHVLCQARMARNLKEAQLMDCAARASDCVTALYPATPGLKGDRVMRRLLQEEQFVGEIREVRITGMSTSDSDVGYNWQSDPDVVGINALTLGMWTEVANRWVGPALKVMAMGNLHHKRRRDLEGNWVEAVVPDSLGVGGQLQCGATITYHLSNCAVCAPGHSLEIYGSRGALIYRFFSEEILGGSLGGSLDPILVPPEEERFQDTDQQFIRAILEGAEVSPSFEEGLRYVEFCEAVALSVETGQAVTLPTPPCMQSWGRRLTAC